MRIYLAGFAIAACLIGIASASAEAKPAAPRGELPQRVRLTLQSPVIDLFQSASVEVTGITARQAEVRLLGATDASGSAYEWTPYRWRRLRLLHGTWHGVLPAPALHGIYRLQLRLDHGLTQLTSHRWLLRVYPRLTMTRRSFPTPPAAVRDFVGRLPGNKVLVALRRWPQATFDHRDPRLNRLLVVAYATRGNDRPSSRLGLFISAVRDGYHGPWRVLGATIEPYDDLTRSAAVSSGRRGYEVHRRIASPLELPGLSFH